MFFLSSDRLKLPVFWLTYLLMIAAMVGQTTWHLYKYFSGVYKTSMYGFFGEMLVNYQGGFIRRGFLGEVLFQLRGIIPFDVIDVVLLLYYASFIYLAYLLFRVCLKQGWSIFLLPFPICLYLYLCDPYIIVGKRDCIILAIAYLGFKLYKNYFDKPSVYRLIVTNVILVIGFLIHESFFFFGIIIIVFHSFYMEYAHTKRFLKCCGLTLLRWFLVFIPFLLVLICSGHKEQIVTIVDSWKQYVYLGEPENTYIYRTIGQGTLVWVIGESLSHWWSPFVWKIPVFPVNFIIGICLYYLITRLNTIDLRLFPLKEYDIIGLSNILLFQFVILLPLCLLQHDLMRLVPYWSVSSLFFFHFFNKMENFPSCFTTASTRVQQIIDKCEICRNQWFYWGLLLLLPIGWYGANISGMFPFIPNELKHMLMGVEMTVNN